MTHGRRSSSCGHTYYYIDYIALNPFFLFTSYCNFLKEGMQHHRQRSACMEGLYKCVLGRFRAEL